MKFMNTLRAMLWLAAAVATPAWAHHSFASFDMDKTQTVTGTVKAFQWTNPHTWIILMIPNGAGGVEEYRVEGAPPVNLIRGGWTEDTLSEGDKVTVDYHPRRDGQPGGTFVAITLPNGRRMGAMGAAAGSGAPATP